MSESVEPRSQMPLEPNVKFALVLWGILLVPWLLLATMGVGMAFRFGTHAQGYALAGSLWSYPILMAVAFAQRRRRPWLAWLPFFSVIASIYAVVPPH